MKLSYDEIKRIAVGAIRIENTDKGLHFYKCTQKQIDEWNKLETAVGLRALSTTGIRLDFHTDSDSVTFGVSGEKFEVLINGTLAGQFLAENGEPHLVNVKLPHGENRVTLVFPSHHIGVLQYVALDDGSSVLPHQFDKKMLFIGDSITQGWNSKYDCMSYAYRVSAFFNANSVMDANGGAFFDPNVFDKIDFDPEVVTVAYGCNDFDRYPDIQTLKQKAKDYLKLIKSEYGDKKLFILLPIWRADCDKPHRMGIFSECRNAISEVCRSLELNIIDAYDFVPHNMDFYDDIVHPIDVGFGVYAENLIAELQKSGI